MYINDTQLKDFILDSGLVSRGDFGQAEEEAQKGTKTLSDILVGNGLLTKDDLRRTHSYILGIPFVRLGDTKIESEVLSIIPEPVARKHNIVAYKKTEDSIEVAMLNTDDLTAIDFIKKKVRLKVLPRLTDTSSIKEALKQYQQYLKGEFGEIIRRESALLKDLHADGAEMDEQALTQLAEELPAVRIVDSLLRHAINQHASDIHIEPMDGQVVVRYRIDGLLHDAMTLPKHATRAIVARIKVLSNLTLDEEQLPQDGRFKMEVGSDRVSFRLSILPTHLGEKIVMRLLREDISGFTLEGLGFHGVTLERIHESVRQKTGMILTAGPKGSGKTTTLYTVLDILNTPDVNISTIEDPIEYQMARVNQTQVKPDVGFTFASGIRALVRQDSDIIMVGEIRDNETASLAMSTALTGHLVLSTLHTNSAAGALPRLVDMEVEPPLLASAVDIIIGQGLVRRLCEIREEYTLSESDLEQLGKLADLERVLTALKEERIVKDDATWDTIPLYTERPSAGCEDGFSGQVGIHEVLKMSPIIKELLMSGASAEEIEQQAKKEGMVTMVEDGIFKAVQGVTTLEEVLRAVSK